MLTRVLIAALLSTSVLAAQPAPTPLADLAYDVDFFAGAEHDPSIPTVEDLLGFRAGDRAAFPHEIEGCLRAWTGASPRMALREYARSHEGRPLYVATISAPENMERLDEIRAGLGRLADPRQLDDAAAERLLESLPGTAWLAYSIHGDETSGSDAALTVIHHLVADRSAETEKLLRDLVVLVDPLMNPDGRHRFLQQVAEHRGTQPNVDDQSLLHTGYWPWGRTNHYGFDLNRDWILATQPETRGRIRAASAWHPLLFVDAHEMGSQDTYLFSPPREPRNPHVPPSRRPWGELFARRQAEAFDRHGWVYYTGEWNEGWYPGYSDAWGELRGAVGVLYEQAGYAEDGVRRPEGHVVTYREAVHHQAVSSLANLTSLRENARDLRRDFLRARRRALEPGGAYDRTFAILPSRNRSRMEILIDRLQVQGFDLYLSETEFTADGVDLLGSAFQGRRLPEETLLVPNRQPEARLLATMLEFDPRIPDDYLRRERRQLLRTGRSTIYDVTAWNLAMMFGLEALTLNGGLPDGARPWEELERTSGTVDGEGAVAWIAEGTDDASVALAARLMEQGVEVRVADRALELAGASFGPGSVVVLPADNRGIGDALLPILEATTREAGVPLQGVSTGLGEGDLPDLGGGHFIRLEPPRIALLARRGVSVYDYGAIWHALDHRVGIRHSHLEAGAPSRADLRRYNVLVLPDRWFGELDEAAVAGIEKWVEEGGTLIALGRSAARLARPEATLTRVRKLRDVLEELDAYEQVVLREWQAREGVMPDPGVVWSHTAARDAEFPWTDAADVFRPAVAELERRDSWQRLFMPQGAFLAGRLDSEHWLTFGTSEPLPILHGSDNVLMSPAGVEAPVRTGVILPGDDTTSERAGWSLLPPGQELVVRMSGLVWPEAVQRLANSALVTREAKGKGQVILFANPASFRGSTLGTERLLLNAMIYGPGFGTDPLVLP